MGPQPKRCHNCKSEDHLIADCPQRNPPAGATEQEDSTVEGPSGGDTAETESSSSTRPADTSSAM